MIWLPIWIVLLCLLGYLLHAFGKIVDEIEDDARHVYAHREREPYGSKFLNLALGRRED